jgi:long-subunit fatty acid transport protein
MRSRISFVALALVLAFGASAQNADIESLAGLTFNFGNPGARSLGMGGAFLGLADDASAAEANPAGLTILIRPEVSLEFRANKTIQTYTVDGLWPEAFQRQDFVSKSDNAEVSFASVIFPAGNWRLGAYYHRVINYKTDINGIFGTDPFGQPDPYSIFFFVGPNGPVTQDQCFDLGADCNTFQLFPFLTSVDISLKTFGASVAYQMGSFSLGVSAKRQEFEESAFTFRTDTFFQPLAVTAQESKDTDYAYTVGFKWAPSRKFSLGGVYKTGGSFDAPYLFGTFDSDLNVDAEVVAVPQFNIPDQYGIGFSYSPVDALKINVDVVEITYSDLTNDFFSLFNPDDSGAFVIDDVTEIRAGFEWFFLNSRIPWAIRGGWFRDPDHSLRYDGPLTTGNQVAARILYPGGEDQDHYSVGIGFAFSKIQLDAAYSTSDKYKVGSISAIYKF